jgi:hypothetical protein
MKTITVNVWECDKAKKSAFLAIKAAGIPVRFVEPWSQTRRRGDVWAFAVDFPDDDAIFNEGGPHYNNSRMSIAITVGWLLGLMQLPKETEVDYDVSVAT